MELDSKEANKVSGSETNKNDWHILEEEDLERILGGGLLSLIKNCFTCKGSLDIASSSVQAARRVEWQKKQGVFRTSSSGSTYFEKMDGTRIPIPE